MSLSPGLFVAASVAIALLSACSTKAVRTGRSGLFDDGSSDSRSAAARVLSSDRDPTSIKRMPPATVPRLAFSWPLKKVQLTSEFGARGDGVHEGIDLKASTGTPVYAAQSGLVLHSGGQISGYGKMVVIRHDHGWATVYAHNSKLYVRAGQKVSKGQKIALSGQTGRASGPHLHFEVRNGVTPYDPVSVLVAGASRQAPAVPVITSVPRMDARKSEARVRKSSGSKTVRGKKFASRERDRVRTTRAAPNRKPSGKKASSTRGRAGGKSKAKTVAARSGGSPRSGKKIQNRAPASKIERKVPKKRVKQPKGRKHAVASAGEPS